MAADREDRFPTARAMREVLLAWTAEHDPHGSLDDLAALFDADLAQERVRVRMLHRLAAPEKPAPPVELPSADLVTDACVPPPSLASLFPHLPKLGAREAFVAAMALVASVAATVCVVSMASLSSASKPEPGRPPVEAAPEKVSPAHERTSAPGNASERTNASETGDGSRHLADAASFDDALDTM
jgi:hypothetical protein